jgi:hypothetical protein
MRALVVYESMYGNTHRVADAIAVGLVAGGVDASVEVVGSVDADAAAAADLLVVGGPTHVHGLSRASTRHAAAEASDAPDSGLTMEPDAEGPGLREWFEALGESEGAAAAFDTRVHKAALLTGQASKGIGRRLRHLGRRLVAEPESFFVAEDDLEPGEEDRARGWGARLATAVRGGQQAGSADAGTVAHG